jgi:riboflavin kinase/FMN adenylyltransferase
MTAPHALPVLREYDNWPRGSLHLVIGEFDGVHIGHRAVLRALHDTARRDGATALAMHFDPIPIEYLAPAAPRSALTDTAERSQLLFEAGADAVVVVRFTDDFAHQMPDEFVSRVTDAGEVRRVIVAPDFRFGHDRVGDIRTLVSLGVRHGFVVDVIDTVYSERRAVTAALVRNALLAGDVADANRLLGRTYSLVGRAAPDGRLRAKGLGHPAIDLLLPTDRLVPRDGVYAVWAVVEGERVGAVANLALSAGASGAVERHLELHFLERETALRGESVQAFFVRRVRDEMRFPSSWELSQQIARDVVAATAALREETAPRSVLGG